MTAVPKLEELTDQQLVERIRGGAREDFEILVRRHNQRLYRAARAIMKSDDEAEDIVQQAWLEVFRNLTQFRGDAAFTTWATRIAVNAAITHARKRPIIAEVPETIADAKPDEDVERAELGKVLEECLELLPQGNREVMVLRDVLELDTAETATLLGLSEEAVRVRLHRARAAVAAELTERMISKVYSFAGERCARITRNVMAAITLQ
ncbi:MAG TPA: sigma-70 family RNA polymerase sigma factor [Kofleriaceae bacterium]|nr:sigma-70 family RNA polymerase sigma factor [Kofleriaceae bacterium]